MGRSDGMLASVGIIRWWYTIIHYLLEMRDDVEGKADRATLRCKEDASC